MFAKVIISMFLIVAALFGSSQSQVVVPSYYPSAAAYYPSYYPSYYGGYAAAPAYAYAWGSNKGKTDSAAPVQGSSLTNNN